MEHEALAAIRNMARQQARAQGLPTKHVIGEAQRERRQPIDIDAETMPAPDGLDHWYGEARNPAAPTGLGEAGKLSRERQDSEDALEGREEKRRKKEREEALARSRSATRIQAAHRGRHARATRRARGPASAGRTAKRTTKRPRGGSPVDAQSRS